jgi:hypothetical protein
MVWSASAYIIGIVADACDGSIRKLPTVQLFSVTVQVTSQTETNDGKSKLQYSSDKLNLETL